MTVVHHGGTWYLLVEKNEDITLVPLDEDRAYPVKDKTIPARTVKQNASIHKYFSLVANSLNDGGFTIQKVVALFKKAGIAWTMLGVKDVIWRNIQIAVTDKESTTKLNSDEVTKVYKTVDYYLTDKIGIEHIPFPCVDDLIFKQNHKD